MLKEIDRYLYSRVEDKVYHVPKEEFHTAANLHYKTMNVKYMKDKKKITYLRYKVLGTVFSGDTDTTLANTIRMAMYNRYANEKAGLKHGVDFVVFSKGDDFSVLYKPYVSDTFIQSIYDKYFLKKAEGKFEICDTRIGALGQICKYLDFGGPESFKFCSLRSWFTNPYNNEDIILTRNPAKLFTISQYSIKTKKMRTPQYVEYLISQAIDYEKNYPDIELFQVMAKAYRAHAAQFAKFNFNNKEFYYIHKKMRLRAKKKSLSSDAIVFTGNYEVDKTLTYLYDAIGRDKVEDLVYDDYWQNVQCIQQSRTPLTKQLEIEYVNDQINAEFDIEELKSLVGLNKF